MTGKQLQAAGIKLFGKRGWQSALATHLNIDRTQIWRYVQNDRVPGPVAAAIECWLANGLPGINGDIPTITVNENET